MKIVLAAAVVMGMGAVVVGAETGTSTGPAASGASTAPTATGDGKRKVPVTVAGKADPRAPGYIVVLENTVDAKTEVTRLEKLYGFKATNTYDMATFKGFAGKLTEEAVEKLRWELNVRSIEHDGAVGINGGGMGAN